MIALPPGLGYYGGQPHLSPHSASMFLRCPEQWRHRYILGEVSPPGAAMLRGRADHKAHELNFGQKIESHQDLPLDTVLDAFADEFQAAIDDFGGESYVSVDENKPLSKVKDVGIKAVSSYHKAISPSIQPTQVEARAEVEVGDVLVQCSADILTAGNGIERKTTSRKQNTPKPDHALQAMTYAAVYMQPFEIHYVADSGTITTPSPETPELLIRGAPKVVETTYNRAALAILNFYNTFGPDDPWPGALTHPWACDPRFCGWFATCIYQGGGR